MIPRLLELAWLMSHRNTAAKRQAPHAQAAAHTIDGMLFVGVRPATHHAA